MITVPKIKATAIKTMARERRESIAVVMITDKRAIENRAVIIFALRISALCSSLETIAKFLRSNFVVAFFSSRLAKNIKNREVTTYITQKMMHRYHIPSVTLTPAAIEAVPMVRGLVIAVVKPTPDAI